MYVLAITTGMREGEILGLHWQDIDYANKVINVTHSVNYIDGKSVISQPKTKKSKRSISLPALAMEVLESLDRKESGLVFTTSSGKPISHRNLLRHFQASLEKAGIKRLRFHDVRHSFATFLGSLGISVEKPYMVVRQKAYSLRYRDKCAGKDEPD